jgi:Flp pilus assembly pilin Flp
MKQSFFHMTAKKQSVSRLQRFLWQRNEGATIIEFALLLPLFLVLLLGVMDFGLLMTKWVLTENALNEVSRTGIVNPTINVRTQVEGNTIGLVDFTKPGTCLRTRAFTSLSDLNNAGTLSNCESVCADCISTAGASGQFVQYQVFIRHDFITPINAFLSLVGGSDIGPITISSSTVLRNE